MDSELLKEAACLGRALARAEMEKDASLADAILRAPVAALAARIAAPEESKTKATAYGLLLGALMGWSAGQKSLSDHLEGKPKKPRKALLEHSTKDLLEKSPAELMDEHPIVSTLLAGAAVGSAPRIGKLLPATK